MMSILTEIREQYSNIELLYTDLVGKCAAMPSLVSSKTFSCKEGSERLIVLYEDTIKAIENAINEGLQFDRDVTDAYNMTMQAIEKEVASYRRNRTDTNSIRREVIESELNCLLKLKKRVSTVYFYGTDTKLTQLALLKKEAAIVCAKAIQCIDKIADAEKVKDIILSTNLGIHSQSRQVLPLKRIFECQ